MRYQGRHRGYGRNWRTDTELPGCVFYIFGGLAGFLGGVSPYVVWLVS